jgi:hypothetical protein
MLHFLKRHPFPVKAFFRQSLVLTYALPSDLLQPLLAPGLALDTYGAYGFLAIALVQTQDLRPSFLTAAMGGDFFLSGYRIFVRLGNGASSLRGLRILRSDTNRRWMVSAGNLLTHYKYRLCQAEVSERPGEIEWIIRTPGKEADLRVLAWTDDGPAPLPRQSPFLNVKDARRFAGPLPYTFDYEPETHSIIRIRGVRDEWHPISVRAEVLENTFLSQEPFCHAMPILASAFYLHDIPYRWSRGVRTLLAAK